MSTAAFVQALIRFSIIYGAPSYIYSDDARSFNAALGGDIMKHHVHSTDFENKFRSYQIKHIKIPLHSPWVGSTWGRLIRVVKSCLYKSIGRSKIKYFDLLTLLTDVQNAINSRPFTYQCSSDSELQMITPNYFLHPNTNSRLVVRSNLQNVRN